jgi:hypothetical protein
MSTVDVPAIFEGFWATEKTTEGWINDPAEFGGGPLTTPNWIVVNGEVDYNPRSA